MVVGADPGGIVVIDAATGVVLEGQDINYTLDGTADADELEGITVWDLGWFGERAPSISGQVHVGMIDQDLYTDQLYFKHYYAASPNNL